VVSVYVQNWRCRRTRKIEKVDYIIILDSTGEMLCPFSVDFIVVQFQCSECLCAKVRMQTKTRKKKRDRPDYFRNYWKDVVPLYD
jgi:hypothetical protein